MTSLMTLNEFESIGALQPREVVERLRSEIRSIPICSNSLHLMTLASDVEADYECSAQLIAKAIALIEQGETRRARGQLYIALNWLDDQGAQQRVQIERDAMIAPSGEAPF